jgi:hypothetical protein
MPDQSPQRARTILRVTAVAGPDEVEAVIPAWAPDRPVRLPATSFGLRPGDRLSALIGRRFWVTIGQWADGPADLDVADIAPAERAAQAIHDQLHTVVEHGSSCWCCCLHPPCYAVRDALYEHDQRADDTGEDTDHV